MTNVSTYQVGVTSPTPHLESGERKLRLETPLINGPLAASRYDGLPTSPTPALHVQPSQPHQIDQTKLEVDCAKGADQHPHGYETSQPPPQTALATPHSLHRTSQQQGHFDVNRNHEQFAATMQHDHFPYHREVYHYQSSPFATNPNMDLNVSMHEQPHGHFSTTNDLMPAGLNISHSPSDVDLPNGVKADPMGGYTTMF